MPSAFGELLSFSNIDDSVIDTLFKLYLDTKLIGLAVQHAEAPAKSDLYWSDVRDFRRKNLDPFTEYEQEKELDKPKHKAASDAFKKHAERFQLSRAFLYWFDMRAAYWLGHKVDEDFLKIITPTADLGNLQREAQILGSRISAFNEYQAKLDKQAGAELPTSASPHDASSKRSVTLLDIIAEDRGPGSLPPPPHDD
jgi:hypothetical protein